MRTVIAGLLMLALALPARAQAPITIVVNFVAGGPSDLMARLLAPEFSAALGSPVVVKNTAGAAGGIGAAEVARSRPDGTTLLLSPVGAMAIQPHFRADLPYKPGDFAPVCQIADTPVVLMAAPNSGIRTVADLVGRARGQGRLQLRLHRARLDAAHRRRRAGAGRGPRVSRWPTSRSAATPRR